MACLAYPEREPISGQCVGFSAHAERELLSHAERELLSHAERGVPGQKLWKCDFELFCLVSLGGFGTPLNPKCDVDPLASREGI